MPQAFDSSNEVLPSELAREALESTMMFRRRTIWTVHVLFVLGVLLLFLWNASLRTALLTPVGPNFHAFMIGLGVFAGIWLAAVEREAWLLGIDLGLDRRPTPKGVGALFGMLALIVASGFAGHFLAGRFWEWQAFHGLPGITVDRRFTVTGTGVSRSGEWLDLQAFPSGASVAVNCSYPVYQKVQTGDRLILPVETGRGGVQRVTLPPLKELRWE